MKEHNIDTFDLNDGKIEYATRKTKKPISKKMPLITFKALFKNLTYVMIFMQFIKLL